MRDIPPGQELTAKSNREIRSLLRVLRTLRTRDPGQDRVTD